MSRSLPPRPDLDQLRRQAKELRDAARAGDTAAGQRLTRSVGSPSLITLSLAQLVIAREHGFPSWARLKAAVTDGTAGLVDGFLTASVEERLGAARRMLDATPEIASFDISTAAVLGDVTTVRELVGARPEAAVTPDSRRGWPPLLYACHSAWHRVADDRAEGILRTVWFLLDSGAGANSSNGLPSRRGYRSALYGAAGIANNPAVTSLLLRYGADPDDDESLYHAAQHADLACLRVLLGHGAKVAGTNAFAAAIRPGNTEGVRLLLEAGGDPGRPAPNGVPDGRLATKELSPLPLAVTTCGVDVVEPLLAAGADPNAWGTDHLSVVRRAARKGNQEVVDLLLSRGARDDTTAVDRFVGACLRADRDAAERILAVAPDLAADGTLADVGSFADAAEYSDPAAVRLMLDLGFPVTVRRHEDGATALHAAAYAGRAGIVSLLLERGADVNAPDGQWGSTALAWASVGSGERPAYARDADWPATVRTLLAAGSTVADAWIGGKPPSEEVGTVLIEHGVEEPDA
ncbi:MAG TPA: ankyrin repeat domain-containing protein [Pseudonocardiaceae bacterium]|jgi:ankyrin repeat protein|nr:ankyrin repeat domain-containing protein [Pseudonocardiaceae bacterium]